MAYYEKYMAQQNWMGSDGAVKLSYMYSGLGVQEEGSALQLEELQMSGRAMSPLGRRIEGDKSVLETVEYQLDQLDKLNRLDELQAEKDKLTPARQILRKVLLQVPGSKPPSIEESSPHEDLDMAANIISSLMSELDIVGKRETDAKEQLSRQAERAELHKNMSELLRKALIISLRALQVDPTLVPAKPSSPDGFDDSELLDVVQRAADANVQEHDALCTAIVRLKNAVVNARRREQDAKGEALRAEVEQERTLREEDALVEQIRVLIAQEKTLVELIDGAELTAEQCKAGYKELEEALEGYKQLVALTLPD